MSTKPKRKYGGIRKGEETSAGTNEAVFDKFFSREPSARTPAEEAGGRPHISEADAHAQDVDANAPTSPDARTPMRPQRAEVDARNSQSVDAHKKDRHRAGKVRQHFRLDLEIDRLFSVFRAEKGLELQEFYELAGVHYIEAVDAHKRDGVDALASHDDRMMMIGYKTLPPIISLYLQYCPDNRWKPRDDRIGQEFNGADIRLVEIGILHTLLRTSERRIHSFGYFRDEIAEAQAVPLPSETIDMLLKRRRQQYEERGKAEG